MHLEQSFDKLILWCGAENNTSYFSMTETVSCCASKYKPALEYSFLFPNCGRNNNNPFRGEELASLDTESHALPSLPIERQRGSREVSPNDLRPCGGGVNNC